MRSSSHRWTRSLLHALERVTPIQFFVDSPGEGLALAPGDARDTAASDPPRVGSGLARGGGG